MKILKFVLVITILFLLNNCGNNYEYWDLDHFDVSQNSLVDGEKISLLYASRSPNPVNEDFYVHFVVVSDSTGDTVNILSNTNFHLTNDNDGLNFVYYSDEGGTGKMLELDLKDQKEGTILDSNMLNSVVTKKFVKVIRDPNFDHIANNKFPTVIGKIMRILKDGQTFEDFL